MIRLWEFLTADGSAAELASIDAHQATATVNESILKELHRARRLRRMPVVWFSPWLRHYLDTFIDRLENELDRREIERLSGSKHHSRSRRPRHSEPGMKDERGAPGSAEAESAPPQKETGTAGRATYTQFEKGLRRAKEVARKQPHRVAYWLTRAKASRRRWLTRLFNGRKRRFLDGFVEGLESHVAAQDASHPRSDEGTPKPE